MKDHDVETIPSEDPQTGFPLDRREFLKLLGPGVFVLFSFEQDALEQTAGQRGYPEDFNAYLKIGADGRVTCYTGKCELGQGISTALAQMLAEELEVPFDSVDTVAGDTRLCPWDGGTNGSRSVKYFGPALRAAGAEAREVLIELAAEKLQIPLGRLVARDGAVVDRESPARRIPYAELVGGRSIQRHLTAKPALKGPSAFKVCGKSLPRKDGLAKVTGKGLFAGDIRLPGMLYARVLRPPAHGAKLKNVDVSAVASAKGARVIQDGDLIAVLHATPDGAEAALGRIKADFDVPTATVDDTNILEKLTALAAEGQVLEQKGDLAAGKELARTKFESTFFTPYIAHAPIETHTATAQVEKDETTVWTSTQRPFGMQEEIARALARPPEKVRIITPFVGGGFGGKSQGRQAVEAARLSKLAGVPVQVAWTREEEFFFDTFRPAAFVKISSGMDESNRIVFWDYRVFFAGERSSQIIYDVPHYRTATGGAARGAESPHPFGTGAWRGPGSNTNIFARESQVDIMAAKAGIDPVEFRLKNLNNPRMARVLKAAAEAFKWTPAKAPSGRGCGVALLDYLGAYVAAMAEVAVDKKTGQIRAKRVTVAQDLGQQINPEGIRVQMEGCVAMGLSSVLSEEIRFKGGEIRDRNFDTYQITRFSWVPEIQTVVVENPELAPQGCGEPTITAMAAVLANALFDATGARAFRLPLTPERIRPLLV
jgi:nicotinate dehydrogenase subunit B